MKNLAGEERRRVLLAMAAAAAAFAPTIEAEPRTAHKAAGPEHKEKEPEVTATEDLMREHGVLRRTLLVYREAAIRLRQDVSRIDPAQLNHAARLFRDFGEEYHEKKLEEAYIFPAVRKAGGRAAPFADVLENQHKRGREITDYMLSVTRGPKINANAAALAGAMDAMVRMYEHHAAREDTIVFPAWKKTLSEKQFGEMSEKFEDIEHQQFGKDGFDDAENRISKIETALGLADLSQFTAPPPPRS